MQITRTTNPRHQVLLGTLAPKSSVPKFPKPDDANKFLAGAMLGSSRMLTAISRGAYSIKLKAFIWKPGHINLLKDSHQRLPPLPPPPLHRHADQQARACQSVIVGSTPLRVDSDDYILVTLSPIIMVVCGKSTPNERKRSY